MNVYKLNISKTSQPHKMAALLRKKKIKRGDRVKLVAKEKLTDNSWMWGLIILFIALAYFFDKKKKNEESSKLLGDLFRNYKTPEEMEKQIRKEYGIDVEIEKGNDEDEGKDFEKMTTGSMAGWYSKDEPDISHIQLREPNPKYRPYD